MINLLRQFVEAMKGCSVMVPEYRLYPWDTVECSGSKLARTPVSKTLWINLVDASACRSERVQRPQSSSPSS